MLSYLINIILHGKCLFFMLVLSRSSLTMSMFSLKWRYFASVLDLEKGFLKAILSLIFCKIRGKFSILESIEYDLFEFLDAPVLPLCKLGDATGNGRLICILCMRICRILRRSVVWEVGSVGTIHSVIEVTNSDSA